MQTYRAKTADNEQKCGKNLARKHKQVQSRKIVKKFLVMNIGNRVAISRTSCALPLAVALADYSGYAATF